MSLKLKKNGSQIKIMKEKKLQIETEKKTHSKKNPI